jgi:hypothetical protein
MSEFNKLTEDSELQLATAAMRAAALNLASLAEAIAEEMEAAGMPDPNGSSALRRLATETRVSAPSAESGPALLSAKRLLN